MLGLSLAACGESEEEKQQKRAAEECRAEIEGSGVPDDRVEEAVLSCTILKTRFGLR